MPQQGRLEMALTAPEYGLGVTPPVNQRPATVGYYQTFDYSYAITGGTGGNTIVDGFNRTVVAGWGTADTGQPWTTDGGIAANYSVNGTQGQVNLPTIGDGTNRHTFIPLGVNAPDQDVLVQTQIVSGGTPIGGVYASGLLLRSDGTSNNMYIALLRWGTDNTITLAIDKTVAGAETIIAPAQTVGTYVTGAVWWIRFTVIGNTLSAKAWLNGTSEPGGYQVVVTDTSLSNGGFVGTRTVRSAASTNDSPVIGFDNFSVGNLYTDSIRALFFAPQRFGENWVVDRVTVQDTSTTQVPSVYVMRGLIRPDSAFNLAAITYPHQPPPLIATSQVVDFTANGVNNVADITTAIGLSPGEYFCVVFVASQFPAPGTIQSSTVFVGGTTIR